MTKYFWGTRHGIYLLSLNHYGHGEYGRRKCDYVLSHTNLKWEKIVLFSGSDYEHAQKDPEGVDAAEGLMWFLTLKSGDVDQGHFEDYTPEQMKFALEEAEELDLAVTAWYEEIKKTARPWMAHFTCSRMGRSA